MTSDRRTCGCGPEVGAHRHATVPARWRAIEGGAAVVRHGTALRMMCGCGTTWTLRHPDVHPRHDVTHDLADLLANEAVSRTFGEVGAAWGVDRRVVRSLFDERWRGVLDGPVEVPEVPVARFQAAGSDGLVLLCDASEPGVVRAYDGFGDPALLSLVSALDGRRVHADWETAPRVAGMGGTVTLHRSACASWVWRTLPSCLRPLRHVLDRTGRTVLRHVTHLIARPGLALSIPEAAALASAADRCREIARFLRLRDGLLTCLEAPDARTCTAAMESWGRGLDVFWRDVFAPVTAPLRRVTGLVVNEGYALINGRRWRALERLSVPTPVNVPSNRWVLAHLAALGPRAAPGLAMTPEPA